MIHRACCSVILFVSLLLPTRSVSAGLFDTFTIEDGLSHNQINTLVQDSLGFLWVATPDGLTRFDGYSFAQYRHDYSDSLSLPANFVGTLFVDRLGNLWVGTFNGICRYNPITNGFVRYQINTGSRRVSEYSVSAIHQMNDTILWVATNKGICQLPAGHRDLVPVLRPDRQPYKAVVVCFSPDPWMERLWMGLQNGGLVVYDQTKSLLLGFAASSPEERLLAQSRISSIVPDTSVPHERVLWVSTIANGIFKLQLIGDRNDSIHVTRPIMKGTPAAPVLSLIHDSQALWVGTAGYGAMRVSRRRESASNADEYQYDTVSFPSANIVTSIVKDHSGNMWFGTHGGLNKMVRRRREFRHHVPPGSSTRTSPYSSSRGATSFFEDSRGTLWVGTQAGMLLSFDPNKPDSGAFSMARAGRVLEFGSGVTAIHEMRGYPGVLWIGTYGNGMFRWDSDNVTHLKSAPANVNTLSSDLVNCITDDGVNLWIGTENGLNMIDPKTRRISRFIYDGLSRDDARLLSNTIWTIVPDRSPTSRVLWIGTVGGGLSRFDPASRVFTHFTNTTTPLLTNRTVPSLYCDSLGALWIGTYSGGLKRLDPSRQSITEYTMHDGLPNNMIQGILPDSKGRLWLSTNNGLCCLDPVSKKVQTFEMHDGLQGNQFHRSAFIKDRTGALLFGGPNGFNRFHPDSITLNGVPPRVVLTQLQVLGDTRSIVSTLTGRAAVELKHTENFLSFEFLAIDFTNPRRNRYAYTLEGADHSWVQSGARRNATYANLSSGRYRFHVKAANNDGLWNEAGVVLSITITPPYWRTWWFLSGALTLFLCVVLATYRFRVRNQIQRRLEIERVREEESEKVRIKTARDFHDEMGHRLTRINMLSETASRKLEQSPTEVKDLLDAIRDNANHLFNGTRDFIWSLDARNDSLFEFAARLKDFGDELFYKTGIAFQVEGIAEDFHSIRLPMETRRQLMLIFKEAMTNSAKHASARRVALEFRVHTQELNVSLSDDGIGFNARNGDSGTGIRSIHGRAQKIQGTLGIDSATGTGTRVSFRGPLTP